jgi:uncharacterized membrane protein
MSFERALADALFTIVVFAFITLVFIIVAVCHMAHYETVHIYTPDEKGENAEIKQITRKRLASTAD